MIKHIVFWQLKDHAEGATKAENMLKMKDQLMTCAKVVPGILEFEVGLNTSTLECTYDVVLYSAFENVEALHAYQHHPKHEAIKGFIGAIRSARQCMDYEV